MLSAGQGHLKLALLCTHLSCLGTEAAGGAVVMISQEIPQLPLPPPAFLRASRFFPNIWPKRIFMSLRAILALSLGEMNQPSSCHRLKDLNSTSTPLSHLFL